MSEPLPELRLPLPAGRLLRLDECGMRNAECGIDGRPTAPDASAAIPHSTFHIPHSYEPSAGARAPRRGLPRPCLADPARRVDRGGTALVRRRVSPEPLW